MAGRATRPRSECDRPGRAAMRTLPSRPYWPPASPRRRRSRSVKVPPPGSSGLSIALHCVAASDRDTAPGERTLWARSRGGCRLYHHLPYAGAVVSQHPKQKPAGLRELSPRSVIVGLLVALVIGASYPYMVLKFGFGPNISVVSAFFGFLALGLVSKSYNRWENNIVQTAGTTAGQIAFLCWLLAAFDIMAADPASGFDVHLTWQQTFVWLSASGLLGVFLAVPLRKHFIEDENLPFPDGMAAGETLIMLDSHGEEGRKSAFAMVGALVASGMTFLATQLKWIVDTIPLVVNRFSTVVGLGFGISLLNIGSGIIIG